MVTENSTAFGTRLLITISFTLIGVELILSIRVPPGLHILYGFLVYPTVFFILPVIGGFICRDPMVAIYISTSSAVTWILMPNFFPVKLPNILALLVGFVSYTMIISVVSSVISYFACSLMLRWRIPTFRITRKSIILWLLSAFAGFASATIIRFSSNIFSYFERHSWTVTLLVGVAGVITTLLTFYLGQRLEARRT